MYNLLSKKNIVYNSLSNFVLQNNKNMNISNSINELYQLSYEQLITTLKSPSILEVIQSKFVVNNPIENHEKHKNHSGMNVSTAVKISAAFLIQRFPNRVFNHVQGTHEIRLYQRAGELIEVLKENPIVPGQLIDATEFCQAFDTWKTNDANTIEPHLKRSIICLLESFAQVDNEAAKEDLKKTISEWFTKYKIICGQEKLHEFWTSSAVVDYFERYGLNLEMP